MGPSEHFLVWRLKRGDREACRQLIDGHHAGVYGYLRRLGAEPALAEDLTQETYARAWSRIDTLRGAGSLRSWLLTIARNEFFQWVRAGRPEAAAIPFERLPERVDERPGAEELLARDERDRAVHRALERLDPGLRETVALHYFQELSFREVGRVLGVPAGTVKSRLNRALGKLRALLANMEAENDGSTRAERAIAGDS